jgi:integrase
MGSITRQSNGRWRARYRDLNGRSRSKTFDHKFEAQQFLDDTSTDLRRGEWLDPRYRQDTFDTWADRWWTTTIKLSTTTRRGYHGVLERHVRPYFSGRKIADIDFVDVEEFIANRLATGLSPKYVRECVSVLSLIMRAAMKAKVRHDNPAAEHSVSVPRHKVGQGDVLSMEQAHRLVACLSGPYKAAVWLLLLTGMRPAELCGLRVRSVDLTRGAVHICETLLPVHRFGDEPYRSDVAGPPKTAAGNRTVPIPQWLCVEVAAQLAQRAERRGYPIGGEEYLFQTRYGNPLNRDKFREKVIRPALKAAGLSESIRTYDLRHTHASLLIDLGANPLALAQRMGHTDPALTLRVYGHLFHGVQEHLTELLDALRESTANAASAQADVVSMMHRTRVGHESDAKRGPRLVNDDEG